MPFGPFACCYRIQYPAEQNRHGHSETKWWLPMNHEVHIVHVSWKVTAGYLFVSMVLMTLFFMLCPLLSFRLLISLIKPTLDSFDDRIMALHYPLLTLTMTCMDNILYHTFIYNGYTEESSENHTDDLSAIIAHCIYCCSMRRVSLK